MEEGLVHNWAIEEGLTKVLPEKVYIWEETLRDGEQTPGVHFTPEEKLDIAIMMDEMGVHIADVGIPVVSEKEKKAVSLIAKQGLDMRINAAARTVKADVDAVIACDTDEISVFVAASNVHLKHKLQMTKDQVYDVATELVEYAKEHGLFVAFVTEDTVRADLDFVERLYNGCIEAGAERVVICDTVGVMTPMAMKWWIEKVKGFLKPTQLSVHCHNDFGLAVANSLAALECGVEVPHTCVNAIGERSGNASFEELVMTLEALYGYDTGVDISRLYELSRKVEELSGIPVAVNKPVVGYNAFSHESGIHAHGVIKHTGTYEPIQPETIGRHRRFIFGKHTGAAAVIEKLERAGIRDLPKDTLMRIVDGIKETAENRRKEDQLAFIKLYREREEKRRGVTDEEFWGVVEGAGVELPPGVP
jgi:isopropylmalate/homocitrate/citramalate synthase